MSRVALFFTFAPWPLYFAGEAWGHAAMGASTALGLMSLARAQHWYRFKATDWTQFLFFVAVVVTAIVPGLHLFFQNRSLFAPTLFTVLAWGSLLVNRPFTNEFAREQIPAYFWKDPVFPVHFARVNRILTVAWGFNFLVALGVAWFLRLYPATSSWAGRAASLIVFTGVIFLTRFFPPWYERTIYVPREKPESDSPLPPA